MSWIDDALEQLAAHQPCGYHRDAVARSEPSALATLALLAHGHNDAAKTAVDWLTTIQSPEGIVGPDATEPSPPWFTAPAVLAWQTWQQHVDTSPSNSEFAGNMTRGVSALLNLAGKPIDRSPDMGHDTTLIGWSWAYDTHSWIEPTCWSMLALCATGNRNHPRVLEGRRLLIDRLLADGGCNYGNTIALGQTLRPHLQPSGLAMLTLANSAIQADADPRIGLTLDYLTKTLDEKTPSASLCYGLLGLTAHNRLPANHEAMLAAAAARTLKTDRSPLKLALLAIAASPSIIVAPNLAVSLSS